MTTTTTKVTTPATMEGATTSAPHESHEPGGRLDDGAAAARTAQLYARYGRVVSGLCRGLLRDRAEAEDAAQQTFLSAHRALLNGSEPRESAAWLAAIARNECWARVRARMREPLAADELDAVAVHDDPLEWAIRRADLTALWAAIEALPRQQRNALLLRELGGLTYDELGEALAVSEAAVESLLFRARRRLRAAFASLSGAQSADALVRLFAGGGAPVAAKAAAVGVGAAAIGGGAVVVPHVFDNHAHLRPPAHAPAVRHREPAVAPRAALLPMPVSRTVHSVTSQTAEHSTSTRGPRGSEERRGEQPVGSHERVESHEGRDSGAVTQAIPLVETSGEPVAGSDGHDGSRDELGLGSGPGSGGSSGEGGSGPSSGGGGQELEEGPTLVTAAGADD
jgi:RNA polymerase sigma-70 factor, ECF subfamily